ncbi:MAG: hypothetical protein HY652_13090 [Acidobacteria bacterium]|nr:hypothetical protein [Acidobacteriota bacterium]
MPAGSSLFLPKGLEIVHIEKAVDYIEEPTAELVELYYEQANVFSGIVGLFGLKALDVFSPYKRHKHPDVAQQRFPDLSLGGKPNPPPKQALESKGSRRPWAVQSHYGHPGWYIIWRYVVDPTKSFKVGREVVIWRVHVAFLRKEDWKYEGSTAGMAGGGRTHTFGLRAPGKRVRNAAAFSLLGVTIRGGRPVLTAGSN